MSEIQRMSHWPTWPLPVLGDGQREVVVTTRHTCGYLPEKWSQFRAFEAGVGNEGAGETNKITGEEYQRLMDAGFRRSGMIVYQPMCAGCRFCVPLRVPVENFAPSRSQRRVLRKNADVVVRVGNPEVTAEKWDLYQRYLRQWHRTKAASEGDVDDPGAFVDFLYRSPVETLELEYRDAVGKLLGVGICDLCPRSLSSVYFYFDPAEQGRSMGTFSALYEIEWARQMKLAYWYAGYWIAQCPTMSYKARFRPCETLGTDGVWRKMEHSEMETAHDG